MNTRDINLLEKAFEAEIKSAVNKSRLYMIQTKSKRAESLVASGLLIKVSETLGAGFTVSGYALTDAGRQAYCTSKRCQ